MRQIQHHALPGHGSPSSLAQAVPSPGTPCSHSWLFGGHTSPLLGPSPSSPSSSVGAGPLSRPVCLPQHIEKAPWARTHPHTYTGPCSFLHFSPMFVGSLRAGALGVFPEGSAGGEHRPLCSGNERAGLDSPRLYSERQRPLFAEHLRCQTLRVTSAHSRSRNPCGRRAVLPTTALQVGKQIQRA